MRTFERKKRNDFLKMVDEIGEAFLPFFIGAVLIILFYSFI